jgi:hypothetical protein
VVDVEIELVDVVALTVLLDVELLICVFVVEFKLVVVDESVDAADDVVNEVCVLVVVVELLVDVEEVEDVVLVGEENPVEIIETVPSLKFVTYTSPF